MQSTSISSIGVKKLRWLVVVVLLCAGSTAVIIWETGRGDKTAVAKEVASLYTHIRMIQAAEQSSRLRNGSFMPLERLWPHPSSTSEREISRGEYDGYRFTVTVHADSYCLSVIPLTDSRRVSMFSDEGNQIRMFFRSR
jgi:hypothetical protein